MGGTVFGQDSSDETGRPYFDQRLFNDFVLGNDVVGFFENPITLKSGRQSHFYVNWRKPTSHSEKLKHVAAEVVEFALDKGLKPGFYIGVPEGATKLGLMAQDYWTLNGSDNYSMPMLRSKPKEHGAPQDRYFVGAPEGSGVVVEDVTTTAGSLISTVKNLKDANVEIIAAIGLTNRMERREDGLSVEEAVKQEGVPYYHMSSALELLPEAARRNGTPRRVLDEVEKEFDEFGVNSLKF